MSKNLKVPMKNRSLFATLAPVFCAALSLSAATSVAWIGTGHKVVALIAWDDLTPKTKEAVTALLKQHHRYKEDLLLDAPADETPDEQARTAFATAATWPDMVRNQDNPMHTLYNHPAWHYIDIPFAVDGQPADEKPPAGPAPHNIVEALQKCTAELKSAEIKDSDKAVDLCWVEHLVGDIHQPLHAASLFSKQFPNGDQGGNAETILRDPPYPDSSTKLHLLWDSLPGDFQSEDLCRYEAQGLRADPKYSREKLKDLLTKTDFMDWAKESHALAAEDAYLNGTLQVGTVHRRGEAGGGGGGQTPGVPPGYMAKAEGVAMHQVSLGGYRLADQLNAIFDPK
jgi:hypothetical protein